MRNGVTLYRIESLIDDPERGIKKGQLGGYIKGYKNLIDRAWVGDEAVVCGNAIVMNSAMVYGKASVSGEARVMDNSKVFGGARIDISAKVGGNATVCENALISGTALVDGDTHISGFSLIADSAEVSGLAQVKGEAIIRGTARVHNDIIEKGNDVINISGAPYNITITPKWMKIGCQCHTKVAWFNFKDKEIYAMDGSPALDFWKVWKPILKKICDA